MAKPLIGKTYSLYGGANSSDAYYEHVRIAADRCVAQWGTAGKLLSALRGMSRKKRKLKKIGRIPANHTRESSLIRSLQEDLAPFTTSVAEHLRTLPFTKRWDRTLAASEEQYHLYMVEIELQNRLHSTSFQDCDTRLAFLPHCLRDLRADCRSTKRGEDYVCKGCSKVCTINALSKLLRRHGVQPYIWMTANLASLIKKLRKEGRRVGVLGIACIPELVSGMRKCVQAGVPVVGVPLDANRCARWWGEFHHNTVNLRQLEHVLGERTLISRRRVRGSADVSSSFSP